MFTRTRATEAGLNGLQRAHSEGDLLADAVVEWMHGQRAGAGRATLDRALAGGIGALHHAPIPLVRLFEQLDREPPWLDRAVARLGCETILRTSLGGYTALAGASLMGGYFGATAVKPLAVTGALTRMAPRRLAETGRFVLDVASSRGMMRVSEGFATTVRVRIMHAMVRRSLRASGGWRGDRWGEPLNQLHMLGATLSFSVVFNLGLSTLGFIVTRREREALMHLWRYVGYVIGVREDLLPTSYREGLELARLVWGVQPGPDADSRALAAALLDVPRATAGASALSRGVGELVARFLGGYARRVLGADAADRLGLPRDAWRFAPLLTLPAIRTYELLRLLTPTGRRNAVRMGRTLQTAYLLKALAGVEPAFEPHAYPA